TSYVGPGWSTVHDREINRLMPPPSPALNQRCIGFWSFLHSEASATVDRDGPRRPGARYAEHRFCGEMDAGVEDQRSGYRVWLSCSTCDAKLDQHFTDCDQG